MSSPSLHSALEKHYNENPEFSRPNTYEPPINKIMLIHDFVHVVYNVDTSLFGEAIAENITYLKTDTKLSHHGLFWISKHGRKIIKNLISQRTLLVMLKILFYMIITLPWVLWNWRAQNKKIPLYIYETHQEVSLNKIRQEYNIRTFKK